MPRICRTRVLVLLWLAVTTLGCRDVLDAETSNFAIINVETVTSGSTFAARPTGLFFNASGIGLASSIVARDSCIIQGYPPAITSPVLDYVDAGPEVVVRFNRPQTQGTLAPRTQAGVKSYVLPEGTSIPFIPGDTITVEIPGATGGLEPITVLGRTAEAFTPAALTLPASNQTDMPVTWTPGATAIPGSAMFYSLRYSAPAASIINREIACFFVDDGNASVPFEVLLDFRDATVRDLRATRVRITINRVANTVTHLTSTFTAPVALNAAP